MPGAELRRRPTMMESVKRPLRRLRTDYRRLTSPLRGLPSALIIGAQKGGTTSLFNYLERHPDVLPPLTKEIHYFDLDYRRGHKWYRGQFPYAHRLRGGSLTFEATPYYLAHPRVPERVAQLLPKVKLIAVLRNPIDRALSHYQHEVRAGRESLSFAVAVDREADRLAGEEERLQRDPDYYSAAYHRHSYLRRGLYLQQLRRWLEHFPRAQLLVLQSEALFRDAPGVMATVHRFLELRPHELEGYKVYHKATYERSVPEQLRTRLASHFEPHNRELFQWLGQEFDWA